MTPLEWILMAMCLALFLSTVYFVWEADMHKEKSAAYEKRSHYWRELWEKTAMKVLDLQEELKQAQKPRL